MTRNDVVEKIISAAIALGIFFLSPADQFNQFFVVFGQGHFLAAYIYQYRAHKIDGRYLIFYAIASAVLFGWYVKSGDLALLTAVTTIYFVIHFLVDERHLAGDTPSKKTGLELLPFLLVYIGLVLEQVFLFPIFDWFLAVSYVIVFGNYGYLLAARERICASNVYILLITAVLFSVFALGVPVQLKYLLGCIILYHYSNWYIHYYVRFAKEPAKRRDYVRTMLLLNAVIIGAYALFRFHIPGTEKLVYVFGLDYFYIWTLLHLIFTTRRKDFGYWLPTIGK